MTQIAIVGYERDTNCQHCGRALLHGVRISDGRVVGATCLDKKMTQPKRYQGKPYRLGSELIIKAAKVVEFHTPANYVRFGINTQTLQFELTPT